MQDKARLGQALLGLRHKPALCRDKSSLFDKNLLNAYLTASFKKG
jgi:hypothetical protein